MKRLFILSLIVFSAVVTKAQNTVLDSLKQQLQYTVYDSLKSPIYSQIADEYLKYDTVKSRRTRAFYQNEALNYTMMALHLYSRYDDTLGLRTSFEALSKVYNSQQKYIQAKWFILQSLTISRARKDTAYMIPSLVKLAAIKRQIADYKLAMGDLNEALTMSVKAKNPLMESLVQKNYAFLYNHMKDYDKGAIALKRSQAILDSMKSAEELQLAAAAKVKQDSVTRVAVANKKKVSSERRQKEAQSENSLKGIIEKNSSIIIGIIALVILYLLIYQKRRK